MASKIFQQGVKRIWQYRADFNGVRYKESLRTTDKKEAERQQRILDARYGGSEDPYVKPKVPKLGELMDAHMEWARDWYKPGKHGRCSSVDVLTHAMKALKPKRNLRVNQITPQHLDATRKKWIAEGKAWNTVNLYLKALKHMFSWGVAHGLVPAEVAYGIEKLPNEQRGRTKAKAPKAHEAVPLEDVLAIKPYLPRPVWGLVQLQLATGARGDELFLLRPCDIDRSTVPWTFSPSHKTEHHGKQLVKTITAAGREALTPFLFRSDDAYLFDPREALAEAGEKKRGDSYRDRSEYAKAAPKTSRKVSDHYTQYSYRNAIKRACERAKKGRVKLNAWTPHQLRATAATLTEANLGREAAQVRLGHTDARMTQHYTAAERERKLLLEVTEQFDPLEELTKLESN